MSETFQIIIGLILVVGVFILTRGFIAIMMRRAVKRVLRDLDRQGAFDEESAVPLPYMKRDFLKMGLRDYRPKAVQGLVGEGIIGATLDQRFFIRNRSIIARIMGQ